MQKIVTFLKYNTFCSIWRVKQICKFHFFSCVYKNIKLCKHLQSSYQIQVFLTNLFWQQVVTQDV